MFHSHNSRLTVFFFTLVAVAAQPTPSPDVRAELARRGLGLSSLIGGNIRRELYFDQTWRDIHLESCCAWGGIEIGTDGTLIGGNGTEVVVLNPQGRQLTSVPEPAYTGQITWNRKTDTIATIAFDRATKRLVLEYCPLGSQHLTVVESVEPPDRNAPPEAISWAPDGSAIAYSKSGRVSIYSLADRKTYPIGDGMNPSWSPDGTRIAYRDKNGHAAVVSLGDRSVRVLMPNVQIRWGVRWSPDSAFILMTMLRPHAGVHEESEFLIYRMRDGKTIRIDPLVGGTTEDWAFWVVKPK